jgi:hypothetical protein
MAASAARIAEVLASLRAASARLCTAAEVRRAHLPFGVPALDAQLAGGLPRGKLTELTGARSSGRMTLALSALAATQRAGELVAVVDAADAFDPPSAHAAGVVLPRLLWVRPPGQTAALQAADRVLDAGGFGLVVLYLAGVARGKPVAAPSQPAAAIAAIHAVTRHHRAVGAELQLVVSNEPRVVRQPEGSAFRAPRRQSSAVASSAWARLQQRAEKAGSAILLVADYPVAGSFSVATLETRRERAEWTGLLDAIHGTVRVVRSKLGAPGAVVELVRAAV